MKTDRVRLREDSLSPEDATGPDLEALKLAKAKQDISHQELDKWIAAAIAELSDRERAA